MLRPHVLVTCHPIMFIEGSWPSLSVHGAICSQPWAASFWLLGQLDPRVELHSAEWDREEPPTSPVLLTQLGSPHCHSGKTRQNLDDFGGCAPRQWVVEPGHPHSGSGTTPGQLSRLRSRHGRSSHRQCCYTRRTWGQFSHSPSPAHDQACAPGPATHPSPCLLRTWHSPV
jgi:hypothetical protein